MQKTDDIVNFISDKVNLELRYVFNKEAECEKIKFLFSDDAKGMKIGILLGSEKEAYYDFVKDTVYFEGNEDEPIKPFAMEHINRGYKLNDGSIITENFLKEARVTYYNRRKGYVEDLLSLHKQFSDSKNKVVDNILYTNNQYIYVMARYFASVGKKVKIPIKDMEFDKNLLGTLFSLILDSTFIGRAKGISIARNLLVVNSKKKHRTGSLKFKRCEYIFTPNQ
jgi:hypothetical protein